MSADPSVLEAPEVKAKIYTIFRDYFDLAERKRRWSVTDDVPWDQCNNAIDPAIADVVQTFCMVELYLPDYLGKLLPQVRGHKGRAWALANWGYEECKHSMVLNEWLLRSGHRSEEQLYDMETEVFSHEWMLPHDNARAMICYTMLQELATRLHYQNLRAVAGGKCPALDKVLSLVAIDEAAHADFFRRIVMVYLEHDREATLEQLRRVANEFRMPATNLFQGGAQREADVIALGIFEDSSYVYEVLDPTLARLGLTRADIRRRRKREYAQVPGAK